jgi:hypothetical protein
MDPRPSTPMPCRPLGLAAAMIAGAAIALAACGAPSPGTAAAQTAHHGTAQPTPSPRATPLNPPRAAPDCAALFPEVLGQVPHSLGPFQPQGALGGTACYYGGPGSQEVASVAVISYPSAQAAESHFPDFGGPAGGIADQATVGSSDCEMPTDDENVKAPGTCGAMRRGAVTVVIASRGGTDVAGLLRAAAGRV